MNFYKKAMGIWEDIEEHGPGGSSQLTIEQLRKRQGFENMSDEEIRDLVDKRNKDNLLREHYRRDAFVDEYGWSVPSKEAIEKIKEFVGDGRVLEVGSGYGLWSKLLRDEGVNTHATDDLSWPEESTWHPSKKQFTSIENISNIEAIEKYPGYNVLMMSWPDYDSPFAITSLETFKGDKIIYIGEGAYGCTGCDRFHALLNKEWERVGEVDIPQWSGLHDYLSLFVRK